MIIKTVILTNQEVKNIIKACSDYLRNNTKKVVDDMSRIKVNESEWLDYVFDNACKDLDKRKSFEAGMLTMNIIAVKMVELSNICYNVSTEREINERK